MRIVKLNNELYGQVKLPASKSISNRLLIMQFLYGANLRIENLSRSDDTVLLSSLLQLVRQYQSKDHQGMLRIDARNAGTVLRFLTATLSAVQGHFLLTGTERMRQRPVGSLVGDLKEIGADIEYAERIGYPPLLIKGRRLSGQQVRLDPSVSSQFITALMLIAPALEEGLEIELRAKPASWPYVQMTYDLMSQLGIRILRDHYTFRIYPVSDIAQTVTVESDWSAASFYYCLLAMAAKGELFFPGLHRSGLQGDQQVSAFFNDLGVETFIEEDGVRIAGGREKKPLIQADFNDYPDLAMPVILAAAAAGVKGCFTGLGRLRFKESDRLEALKDGLLKTGIRLEEQEMGKWSLSGTLSAPCDITIDEKEDHRVAMTFACLAIKGFRVSFDQSGVVSKSYPGFWNDLESLGFVISG